MDDLIGAIAAAAASRIAHRRVGKAEVESSIDLEGRDYCVVQLCTRSSHIS